MHNKDIMCFQVFSTKYFLDGDVFQLKYVKKPTYAWASILPTLYEIVDEGFWWEGDGASIRV